MTSVSDDLRQAYQQRHELARSWRAQGRRLCGYLYSYVPEELIHAAGMVPIQLTSSDETTSYEAGKELLEDFFCDFARSCIGQAVTGVYDYLDGVIFPDACETERSLAALWKLHSDAPFFHWLTTCFEDNAAAREFFRIELLDLKARLEDFIGHRISDDAIRKSVRVYNENRDLMRQVYELRQGDKRVLSAREALDAVFAGLVMPKEDHTVLLRKLIQEGLRRESDESTDGPRLLLSCHIFEEATSMKVDVVTTIEELGGRVEIDDLCTGLRYFWEPVTDDADWSTALVERYIARVPGAFKYLGTRRGAELLSMAKRHNVQGAIFVIPRYCTPYSWDDPHVRQIFEDAGLPTLMIESDHAMASLSVRTRIEAFLEMLEGPC